MKIAGANGPIPVQKLLAKTSASAGALVSLERSGRDRLKHQASLARQTQVITKAWEPHLRLKTR